MKRYLKSMPLVCLVISIVLFSVSAQPVQGGLLSITLDPNPDVTGGLGHTTSYTGDDFSLSIDVYQLADTAAHGGTQFFTGNLTIDATISTTGVLSSGTMSMTGTVGTHTSGNLLTGNLTGVGFDGSSDFLEFTFDIVDGDLATRFGGAGSTKGGIILGSIGFLGNFSSDFSDADWDGVVDVGVIPEPATLSLLGLGMMVCRLRRRR